jgi:hypothetical protein
MPQGFTATLTTNSTTTTNTSTFGQFLLSFSTGVNGVLYVISPAQALFMETDAESSVGLEAGQILAQTSASFSNGSLNGTAVEYEQGLGSTAGQPLAAIGLINFGASPISVSRDIDDSGTLDGGTTTPETASLTLSSVMPYGRAVLSESGSPFAIAYLVAANEGFIMSATSSATMGFFQPQAAGPFSAASISGDYFFGSVPPSAGSTPPTSFVNPTVTSGEFTSPGNGGANITIDISRGSTAGNSLLLGETGFLDITTAPNGRAIDTQGDVYYLMGPSSLLMLIPNAAGTRPPTPQGPLINAFQQ